jgi:transposase
MNKAWAGVDAGKEFHWACVLDASGRELLSRKVENDEADLFKLIDDALLVAEEVVWAVDQPGGGAALLLALLWERNQKVLYVPGLSVDRARETYRGESKTDARDARVIADQARMRSDLGELRPDEEEISELQLLLARRRDLITDRSRTITRLRETLLSLFPALERALDLNSKGPLTLLIAKDVLALKERIESVDEEIGQRFFVRPEARILVSLPGMGPILGAEFLVAVGDMCAFESADRLAAYTGLVPATRDSGKRVGKHRFLGEEGTRP